MYVLIFSSKYVIEVQLGACISVPLCHTENLARCKCCDYEILSPEKNTIRENY